MCIKWFDTDLLVLGRFMTCTPPENSANCDITRFPDLTSRDLCTSYRAITLNCANFDAVQWLTT